MTLFGLAIVLMLIVFITKGVSEYFKDRRETREQLRENMGDDELLIRGREPSLFRRLILKPRYWFASRKINSYEMLASHDAREHAIQVKFFVPRRFILIDIFTQGKEVVLVEEIEYQLRSDKILGDSYVSYKDVGATTHIRLFPPKITWIDEVTIHIKKSVAEFEYKVEVRATNDVCSDLESLSLALSALNMGEYKDALSHFREYDKVAAPNPFALYVAADANHKLGRLSEGKKYALRTAIHGLHDGGSDLYREIVSQEPPESEEEINRLKAEMDSWAIDPEYGVVSLRRTEDTTFGLDKFYLINRSELLLVRRPAAARLLRLLTFDYPSSQILMHTSAQIRRTNGKTENLSLEFFDISESVERNVFIRTANDYTGSWILPDLFPGDVIEWSHHLLCREFDPVEDSTSHFLARWRLCRSTMPLLEGKATYMIPEGFPTRFSCSDTGHEITGESSKQDGLTTQSFSLTKYAATQGVGFPYVEFLNRPSVVCSAGSESWESVAKSLAQSSIGDLDYQDDIPPAILGAMDSCSDTTSSLEHAFYWIRDKLKYGSFNETSERIGKEKRAMAIVESGLADCKDKSYLLHQVCRHLGKTAQYLLVSSEYGKVLFDHPSDQFDHVIIRVRTDGGWQYLDATSSYSVFTAPPLPLQGMNGLVLETGEVIAVPVSESSVNRIDIQEGFDSLDSGWLSGEFNLHTTGHAARLADENWKSISLGGAGQQTTAQSFLQAFMPSVIVKEHRRLSDTSTSDELKVWGREMRCRLTTMGGYEVGMLEWNNPIQSIYDWRSLPADSCFAFRMPCRVDFNITFRDELAQRLNATSHGLSLDNELCCVSTNLVETDDSYNIKRQITIKEKYVSKENSHLLEPTMEALEEAFRLAVSLNRK
jgi:hypothetical protein